MAAHAYIAESDFHRYARSVAHLLSSKRQVYPWTNHAGSVYKAYGSGSVSVLFQAGKDLGAPESALVDVDAADEWFYDSATDTLYLYSAVDPDTQALQAGEDHETYVTAMIEEASRVVDSRLDARFQTPIPLNRSGAYDAVIKQACAYELAAMVSAGIDDEQHDKYISLLSNEFGTGVIDELNAGKRKLEHEIDATSSSGELRVVSVAGGFHPRVQGAYVGTGHDRLKLIIETGGAAGTAKFQVYGYDSDADTPKTLAWFAPGGELVNLFQRVPIGNGLYLIWEADDGATATANDEWEIQVYGDSLPVDNPVITTVRAVR